MSFTGCQKGGERIFQSGRSQAPLYTAPALEHDPSFKGCSFHSYRLLARSVHSD